MKLLTDERGEVTTFVVVVSFLLAGGLYGLFAGLQAGGNSVKQCIIEEAERNPNAKLGVVAPVIVEECKP